MYSILHTLSLNSPGLPTFADFSPLIVSRTQYVVLQNKNVTRNIVITREPLSSFKKYEAHHSCIEGKIKCRISEGDKMMIQIGPQSFNHPNSNL